MKPALRSFLIFFSIVLALYGLINFYVFNRLVFFGGYSIPLWAFIGVVMAYPLGRLIERAGEFRLSQVLMWMGSFWLAAMLWFFLLFLFLDLVDGIFRLAAGSSIYEMLQSYFTLKVLGMGMVLLVFALLGRGFWNVWNPVIRNLRIPSQKAFNGQEKLRLAIVSDVHAGTLVGKKRLGKMVKLINSQQPDVVLIAGDLLDEDVEPAYRQDAGQILEQLQAPLGVFAITGNHEYIGGITQAAEYITGHGIRLLRDEWVDVDGHFLLVGREDRDKVRFDGTPRMGLGQLIDGLDFSQPVVLMDHQPTGLDRKARYPFDLVISGHTHHGQIWPLNLITRAVFKLSRGYEKMNGTHFIVSSGYGTWGPPVRIGSRAEIVVVDWVQKQ